MGNRKLFVTGVLFFILLIPGIVNAQTPAEQRAAEQAIKNTPLYKKLEEISNRIEQINKRFDAIDKKQDDILKELDILKIRVRRG